MALINEIVIPAKAGIQLCSGWLKALDPGFRRDDEQKSNTILTRDRDPGPDQ